MGDGAMAALVALLEEGALPNLKRLDLEENQLSDAGVAALASALRGGALPSCTRIDLYNNPGSEAPVQEALKSYFTRLYMTYFTLYGFKLKVQSDYTHYVESPLGKY